MQPVRSLHALPEAGLLWQGQERFHGAFMHSGIGMAIVSLDGRFLDVNTALCRFLGYEEADLLKLDFQALTHPADLELDLFQVNRMQAREIETYSLEKRYRHRAGHFITGLLTVSMVCDAEGKSLHFLSQVQDIGDRKRIEEELRMERERLTLATEAGGVGVWDVSLNEDSVACNEVARRIFRVKENKNIFTREEALQFIHPDDRERVSGVFRACVESNIPYASEHRLVSGDDEIHYARAFGRLITDEGGQPIRVIGTVIDITTEKRASEELSRARDAAETADRAKTQFLAMMSHEIRTPMNGVLGFASLLKATPLDSHQLGYLDTIETSAERLLELVNEVLDLSKIESGTIRVQFSPFDLRSCLAEAIEVLRPAAMQKGLFLEYEIPLEVPSGMMSDRGRLAQILINILGNAVKFTVSGGVRLRVSSSTLTDHRARWTFCVEDSGPGVAPETLPKLFQQFFQENQIASAGRGGSGLGLAISQRLAGLLGGSITAENRAGGGMVFRMVMDADVVDTSPARESSRNARVYGGKILVVEDNEANRLLCDLQLRHLGCEADFAFTGTQAIEKYRTGQYDLIFMDMQLPEKDGCSATMEIRSIEKESGGRVLPIIAMTANAMPEDRRRCLDSGMSDYLSKPLRLDVLSAMIAKWI